MTGLDWVVDMAQTYDPATLAEREAERRRRAVARAQVKSLRRQRRRDTRLRVFGWCRRNKMAVYPVAAVASFTVGLFTVGALWGFITLGVGLVVLEWRFSK